MEGLFLFKLVLFLFTLFVIIRVVFLCEKKRNKIMDFGFSTSIEEIHLPQIEKPYQILSDLPALGTIGKVYYVYSTSSFYIWDGCKYRMVTRTESNYDYSEVQALCRDGSTTLQRFKQLDGLL